MNIFKLKKRITQYFDHTEISYTFDDEENVFYIEPPKFGDDELDDDPLVITALVVRDELLHCYASYTFNINQEDLPLVSEFIQRVNICLARGAFQLDFDDGEIRFFTYLDCPDDMKTLTDGQLNNLIMFPLLMLGLYLEPLSRILERELSPQEALDQMDIDLLTDLN